MTQSSHWLLGSLATHARGKVIAQATAAMAVDLLPDDSGTCIAFGSDFQNLSSQEQQAWIHWSAAPGRTLLLVPPYNVGECHAPVNWRAFRPQKPEPNAADSLGKLLANEVRFEVTGPLQTAIEVVGEWKGGGVHTAYYRKHPHSGLFAITCLPIWSLTVLDHRHTLCHWLQTIGDLAGEAAPPEPAEEATSEFHPTRDHFAVMLCLCERPHDGNDAALEYLAQSQVFAIPADAARVCLNELDQAGLAIHGQLTEQGRATLLNSPYAVYASAMERNH